MGERLITWWGKVLDALGGVISAVFGFNLPKVSDIVDKIKGWWQSVLNFLGLDLTVSGKVEHGGGNVGSFGTNNNVAVDGSHASGLDFVPRDEYLARLHYGEAVLTRKEADVWRKGGNSAQLVAEMQQMREAFAQTMEAVRNQPVAIQVDSRAVAVLMAKEMTRSIGNRNIQTLMGMGG